MAEDHYRGFTRPPGTGPKRKSSPKATGPVEARKAKKGSGAKSREPSTPRRGSRAGAGGSAGEDLSGSPGHGEGAKISPDSGEGPSGNPGGGEESRHTPTTPVQEGTPFTEVEDHQDNPDPPPSPAKGKTSGDGRDGDSESGSKGSGSGEESVASRDKSPPKSPKGSGKKKKKGKRKRDPSTSSDSSSSSGSSSCSTSSSEYERRKKKKKKKKSKRSHKRRRSSDDPDGDFKTVLLNFFLKQQSATTQSPPVLPSRKRKVEKRRSAPSATVSVPPAQAEEDDGDVYLTVNAPEDYGFSGSEGGDANASSVGDARGTDSVVAGFGVDRDEFDDTWTQPDLAKFKKVLDDLHEYLPELDRRKDESPRVQSLATMPSDTVREENIQAFPQSPFIRTAFDRVHAAMWNVDDPSKEDLSSPLRTPTGSKEGRDFLKDKVQYYKRAAYSHRRDPFSPDAPTVSEPMRAYSTVQSKKQKVEVGQLEKVESLCRRALLAMSATDMLVGATRRIHAIAKPTDDDLAARDRLSESLVKAIKHTGTFLSNAIASSMLARRRAFVDAVPERYAPSLARSWLVLQPLLPEKQGANSLFGDVVPKLEKFARESTQREIGNVVQVSQRMIFDRTTSTAAKPPARQAGQSGGKSRNRNRKRRGKGGAKAGAGKKGGKAPPAAPGQRS